jgi:acylphosphatase
MYYLEIMNALKKARVRYLLIGGVALVIHGIVRLTADIDILLSFDEENVARFVDAMNKLGFKPRLNEDPYSLADSAKRASWAKRNMKAFSFIHKKDDYKIVDVLIESPILFNDAYGRRKIVTAEGKKIDVLSLKDLITLKKASMREQDLIDIRMLEELLKNEKAK